MLDIIEHTTIVRTNPHLGRIKLLGLSLSLRFLLKDTTLSYFEDEIHVAIPGQPVAFAHSSMNARLQVHRTDCENA
jgi:hypothetical protein